MDDREIIKMILRHPCLTLFMVLLKTFDTNFLCKFHYNVFFVQCTMLCIAETAGPTREDKNRTKHQANVKFIHIILLSV
jgi:hypothetical protein